MGVFCRRALLSTLQCLQFALQRSRALLDARRTLELRLQLGLERRYDALRRLILCFDAPPLVLPFNGKINADGCALKNSPIWQG